MKLPYETYAMSAVYAEKHYCTDIFNVIRSADCPVALSNPIWLEDTHES